MRQTTSIPSDRSEGECRRVATELLPVAAAILAAHAVLWLVVRPIGFFLWVRAAYAFTTVVVPLALGGMVLTVWLRGRRRRGGWLLLAVAILLAGVRLWATHIEPRLLRVRRAELASQRLDRPLRLLHVSDLQAARVGAYEADAIARMAALEPDLVLFTGDLIQPWPRERWDEELAAVAPLLATIRPPLGFLGVCGNTDGRLCKAPARRVGGLELLANEGVVVPAPGGTVAVYGLAAGASHDPNGLPAAAAGWLTRQRRAGSFTVLLGHAPDFALAMEPETVDLALAGHTHGGQIRLPGFGPIITLSRVPRAWARGMTRLGPATLHVSAGIGAEHAAGLPSIRFFCPPEMSVIEIIPSRRVDG